MGVRATSREAYHSLTDLSSRQAVVLKVIEECGPICNLDIAARLRVPINTVTPRTNELVQIGRVCEAFRRKHPRTHRRSIYWKVQ